MTSKKAQRDIPIVDRPEVSETFADSVVSVMTDASVFRIEFAVKRGHIKFKDQPPVMKKYTSARIVLTHEGAVELVNNLTNMLNAMAQASLPKGTMN